MANLQLSKNLITLRKLHHFTQSDLSEYLHISRQAYSNYENMKRNPDLESIQLLCSLYHISLDELINHNIGNEISSVHDSRHVAMDISTATTLYLTSEETHLVMKYRDLEKEKRSHIRSCVDSLFD